MLPHSLVLSRAIARTMMPDTVRLATTQGDPLWTGRCNLQSLREQVVETLAGHVVVQLYELTTTIDAPTFGWTLARLTESANHELLGELLVIQTRPMDSHAAMKRFVVTREQQ